MNSGSDGDHSVNSTRVTLPPPSCLYLHHLPKTPRRQRNPEKLAWVFPRPVSGHPSLLCVLNSMRPQQPEEEQQRWSRRLTSDQTGKLFITSNSICPFSPHLPSQQYLQGE